MNTSLQGTSGWNALAMPIEKATANPQLPRATHQIIERKMGCELGLLFRWPTGGQKPYWYAKGHTENKIELVKIQQGGA